MTLALSACANPVAIVTESEKARQGGDAVLLGLAAEGGVDIAEGVALDARAATESATARSSSATCPDRAGSAR